MIHGTGCLAMTTAAALAVREAEALASRLLAYRQQRWLIKNTERAGGKDRSIEITGIYRISIRPARVRRSHGK